MPDYQKSKIYKLWSPSKNLVYYGSTTETLSKRLGQHKARFDGFNSRKCTYKTTSYYIIVCEDYKIELVENYPCENKEQLHRKEAEYIKNNDCVNKFIPGRTDKEYREDTKEHIKKRDKEYREDNKERIKEREKQYYEDNKERILERTKKYYEDNKERVRERAKKYYEDNKERILERRKEKRI